METCDADKNIRHTTNSRIQKVRLIKKSKLSTYPFFERNSENGKGGELGVPYREMSAVLKPLPPPVSPLFRRNGKPRFSGGGEQARRKPNTETNTDDHNMRHKR